MKIRRAEVFLRAGRARDRCFFQSAKYIPDASLDVVCFFIDEQPGEVCHFSYKHWGKNPKIAHHRKQSLDQRRHFKTRLKSLERVEMSSQFCFLRWAIFIRIFANSVCIKRTHRPGCTALEKYT